MKMMSGSSGDKEAQIPPLIPREGRDEDGKPSSIDRHNGDDEHRQPAPFHDPRNPYNDNKSPNSAYMNRNAASKGNSGDGIAGYVPAQRLEWKRYKQYTRNDIMEAIEEVKKGKSALQVSKRYNIPSRTLYDKVKKMGITTGRQQQRKSMNSNFNTPPSTVYSAAFPNLNMMGGPMHHLPEGLPMENPYKNLMDRMKEVRDDEDSRDTRDSEGLHDKEGPKPKDLGPMPFSILPPHMLNMMERIKSGEMVEPLRQEERAEATSPMNLSSEREESKRMSEGSFGQSPSPGSRETFDSPSQASPPSYSEVDRKGNNSPDRQQIDIRAQFLADLRRTTQGDGQSPELDLSRATGGQESLPPRKRKVSQEDQSSDEQGSPKLNLQDHKSLSGMEESSTVVI